MSDRLAGLRPTEAPLDRARMEEALGLAVQAIGLSDPNPRVGCVIGREDGNVAGRGHTQMAGGAHAEVMALRDAAADGQSVAGATAWVTLEPCSHPGRTPPCCSALIQAGIRRVVVAMADPNPLVDGRGILALQANGIEVVAAADELRRRAEDLNIGFVSRHRRGRPWVRVKAAQSIDGRVALANGTSRWITSSAARLDGHLWRRRAGAIVTGIGTLLADDPQLNVRPASALQPLRVVLDPQWRTPLSARTLAQEGRVLIVGGPGEDQRRTRLKCVAETLVLPLNQSGKPSPALLMAELHRRGVNEVHLEAGPTVNGALLRAGLIDEWLIYVAPRWIGPGRPAAELPAIETLPTECGWEIFEATTVGPDLRLRLRQSASFQRAEGVAGLDTGAFGRDL